MDSSIVTDFFSPCYLLPWAWPTEVAFMTISLVHVRVFWDKNWLTLIHLCFALQNTEYMLDNCVLNWRWSNFLDWMPPDSSLYQSRISGWAGWKPASTVFGQRQGFIWRIQGFPSDTGLDSRFGQDSGWNPVDKRSWEGYSQWGHKSQIWLSDYTTTATTGWNRDRLWENPANSILCLSVHISWTGGVAVLWSQPLWSLSL